MRSGQAQAALYSACRLKAESKAVKKNEPPDFTKCDAKLSDKWTDAETKAEGACPTNGDLAQMQTFITGNADDIATCLDGGPCGGNQAFPATGETTAHGVSSDGDVQAGATLSFTDNGDGTITDNNTGLMWEKKDNSGGIHDVANSYTWCKDDSPADGNCDTAGLPMDGTISTTFLATLNGGGGFAGHTDWRHAGEKKSGSERGVVA